MRKLGMPALKRSVEASLQGPTSASSCASSGLMVTSPFSVDLSILATKLESSRTQGYY